MRYNLRYKNCFFFKLFEFEPLNKKYIFDCLVYHSRLDMRF